MSRKITLVAEIPDADEIGDDIDVWAPFSYTINAEGIDPELVAPVLLSATLALVQQTIRQEAEAENPLGNTEFMDKQAALEARMMLFDMTVHLPDRDQDGIVTTIG